ncbi:MAG: UPF0489 family protein [Calditrichaceae bacterium]|nr:UPF0489 family protein [Calditrichaceae bacterium]MBN2707982.1 UPF0489 family protein [Calditrichaceae bacterium]RQV95918.1 MAG: hypothetical protein EH224_06005 [Calditrichota bacterium]
MKDYNSIPLQLYKGFFTKNSTGNNAFSFDKRKNQNIYVAPLIHGTLMDLKPGDYIAFSEVEDGKEINRCGLKNFIWMEYHNRHIFIFDNHNHAFFFWMWGYLSGNIYPKSKLLHIDQHKDTREPDADTPFKLDRFMDLKTVWQYTNEVLNVGNFIPPAVKLGLFSEIKFIIGENDFKIPLPGMDVVDLDMDIFAPEMDYIDYDLKFNFIKSMVRKAKFLTISTSPYFMDQNKAIGLIKQLLF